MRINASSVHFYIFFILSKSKTHSNHIFRILCSFKFFLLHCHKHLIRNNGLMGAGVKIPIHEAVIFYLNSASADRFLEQHPPCIFFIGEQFVDGFPIPSGLASGGGDPCLSKPTAIFPRLLPARYCSNIQHTTRASSGFTASSPSGFISYP